MWISDLFMKRVEAQEQWSLMCPHECPGLSDTYGDEFEALYTKYENEGKYRRIVPVMVCHTRSPNRDWNTLYVVQRCMQQEE